MKVVGSTTTRYLYSGSKPIAEYVNGSTTPSKEYIYAGSQVLAMIAGTNTTYHHPDHLSIRAETDATGAVVSSTGLLPFGDFWYGSSSDQFKFTSYARNSGTGETGIDYAMFRHYNPGQGRFNSADLLGGTLGLPQSLNRYAYTLNDPINLIDRLGLNSSAPTLFWQCVGNICTYIQVDPGPTDVSGNAGSLDPTGGAAGGGGHHAPLQDGSEGGRGGGPDKSGTPSGPFQAVKDCIQTEMEYALRFRADTMANQNNRILRNMGKGFIAGAWVGAEKGFVGSEILGGAETGGLIGVPGAIVGGFVGGVIGAGGALLGTFFGNLGNQALSDFQFNQRLHDNIKKNCGVNVTVVGHP